uniref:Ena/VASP-like protein n=1 Tax=Anthurium amnicola TaxID=1678845 RepID=A0A1D1ZF73_9ARAE
MDLMSCSDLGAWREALSSYPATLESLQKPHLLPLDDFYRDQLPLLLRQRDPDPFITKPELSQLMQWKLSRGKWRPRLQDFVSKLEETQVESASRKAFRSLPDLSKAVSELTVLKGVGPATASAVIAAYAPDVAPFMSDEAMVAALGNKKEYTLKQYLVFAKKLQEKSKELCKEECNFTASDVERALWSFNVGGKLPHSPAVKNSKSPMRSAKRKRKM